MNRRPYPLLLPILGVFLVACTTAATPAPAAQTAPPTSGPVAETQSATLAPPAAAIEPWRTIAMEDVRSGETFSVADLAGKLVVIEPMAIWCSNCERQQRAASEALSAIDSDDVVYISLDVDPGEATADLAAYADKHGFDWRFVVAGREMSRALAESFGDQVLAPPSTPKILVAPDGVTVGPLFGMADPEALEQELLDHLS